MSKLLPAVLIVTVPAMAPSTTTRRKRHRRAGVVRFAGFPRRADIAAGDDDVRAGDDDAVGEQVVRRLRLAEARGQPDKRGNCRD